MKNVIALIMITAFSLIFCCGLYAVNAEKAENAQSAKIFPKKVSIDTIGDGKPNRFEYYDDNGNLAKVEIDSKGSGAIDETIIYENGKPVKSWKDTKGTGKPDVWLEY